VRDAAPSVLDVLKAGEVKLAIAAEDAVEWDRFDRWALFEEGFVVVLPPGHALAGRNRVTVSDIADEA